MTIYHFTHKIQIRYYKICGIIHTKHNVHAYFAIFVIEIEQEDSTCGSSLI
jgi:hypothetical protein